MWRARPKSDDNSVTSGALFAPGRNVAARPGSIGAAVHFIVE
jgi:hypothetical protein